MQTEFQSYINFIEFFREHDSEMQLQTAVLFLNVVMDEGVNMTELSQRVRISRASVSRNVAALSQWNRHDKPGLNLVLAKEDPSERRRKLVYLTSKGKELAEKLK